MNKIIDIILYLLAGVVIVSLVTAVEMKKNEYEEMIEELDEEKIRGPIQQESLPKNKEVNFAIEIESDYDANKQVGKKDYYKKRFLPRVFKRR